MNSVKSKDSGHNLRTSWRSRRRLLLLVPRKENRRERERRCDIEACEGRITTLMIPKEKRASKHGWKMTDATSACQRERHDGDDNLKFVSELS